MCSHLNILTPHEKCEVWDRKGIAPRSVRLSAPKHIIVSQLCFEASCSNVCPLSRCESLLHNKYRKGVLVCVCMKGCARTHTLFLKLVWNMMWIWVTQFLTFYWNTHYNQIKPPPPPPPHTHFSFSFFSSLFLFSPWHTLTHAELPSQTLAVWWVRDEHTWCLV